MKARHWAEVGESTFVLGIWLLYWIHRLLGRWPFRLCLYPVVFVHWLARPLVRDASLQYLARVEQTTGVLGRRPGRRDSLRHMMTFAETMLDKLLAVSGRYRFEQVRTEGREQFYEAAKSGRGGIIVTAHLGCLELCRAMAERRGEVKLTILVHTRHAEQFNRLLKRLNPDSDFRLLEVTDMGPATAVALQERVSAGEFVVIAGDRVPVHSSQTVSVDFLGHAAPFPVGPYVLAGLFKCPLFLLGCIHEGPGYTIHFECLAERVELPRGKRVAALTGYARQYADRLTALLRRSPFDWFNFFPFWDQAQANVSAGHQE
ncbi:acyltransferase [Myxococcus sp. RHSTA-1-4]|uniref:LpxL/LpxP family acyltransferase n=1 Tax=Myxococcus sp. RHSTA-1-4 TaxID=2874601 RepID=UPI001CBE6AE3|nr:acyltransferase [Myxococcus sp. RHSTA-1-4]MBZ4415727.1 acyltransferase [Myxococcus sp. RHSTA-1-4]